MPGRIARQLSEARLGEERECEIVRRLFREAWPAREPPSGNLCYTVATAINVVRIRSFRVNRDTKKPGSLLGTKGEKYARLFVRHGELARQKLEDDLTPRRRTAELAAHPDLREWVRGVFDLDRYEALFEEMSKATRQVEALLAACKTKAIRPNPARFLADTLQQAWRTAGDEIPPRSVNRDDPLCRFVHGALAEAGVKYSLATVSDMLRGRAGRRRSGGKNSVRSA